MNSHQQGEKRVGRLYWRVDPVSLHGVVDRMRTTLTALTAEIRATMPDNSEVVPAPGAENALHVATSGNRNKITITAPRERARRPSIIRRRRALAVG